MGKRYKYIFFDLDHTLWDFESNSNETLKELVVKYKIDQLKNFNLEVCLQQFHTANYQLWDLFNEDKITSDELRNIRFLKTFENLDFEKNTIFQQFNEDYIRICSQKGVLIPHALETLSFLFNNYYNLYILTNGFEHVQLVKLTTSNIFHFFEEIFTVKDTGHKKPNPLYFYHVLERINANPSECLMIGDSLDVDVLAAMNVGIDAVWFNPENKMPHTLPTFQINSLQQLSAIIENI